MFTSKTKLMAVASALAMSAAALSSPQTAMARGEEDGEAQAAEEIFVTARGREESLQDIPESIIALDADDLEVRGVVDIIQLFNQAPNLYARRTFRAGVTFFTIRGVTASQQGWALITYVVDGVKTATVDAINQNALFGIERVEVLKGPQGGLYGAGAIAGASSSHHQTQ